VSVPYFLCLWSRPIKIFLEGNVIMCWLYMKLSLCFACNKTRRLLALPGFTLKTDLCMLFLLLWQHFRYSLIPVSALAKFLPTFRDYELKFGCRRVNVIILKAISTRRQQSPSHHSIFQYYFFLSLFHGSAATLVHYLEGWPETWEYLEEMPRRVCNEGLTHQSPSRIGKQFGRIVGSRRKKAQGFTIGG
jgi:hypothetical protein